MLRKSGRCRWCPLGKGGSGGAERAEEEEGGSRRSLESVGAEAGQVSGPAERPRPRHCSEGDDGPSGMSSRAMTSRWKTWPSLTGCRRRRRATSSQVSSDDCLRLVLDRRHHRDGRRHRRRQRRLRPSWKSTPKAKTSWRPGRRTSLSDLPAETRYSCETIAKALAGRRGPCGRGGSIYRAPCGIFGG